MPIFSRKLTKEDCDKWKVKKNKNPITNYKITPTSIIYKQLEKECNVMGNEIKKDISLDIKQKIKDIIEDNNVNKKKILSRDLTLEDCLYWEKYKKKNPISKYTLSENSPILKEVAQQCSPVLKKYKELIQPKIPTPPQTPKKITQQPKIPTPPQPSKKEEEKQLSPYKNNDVEDKKIKLYYPDLEDTHFKENLSRLYEFYIHSIPEFDKINTKDDFNNVSIKMCGDFEKTLYQHFVSHYISVRTPYRSLLLYHGVGVGKTCSAITISEGLLEYHNIYDEPKIWVIMPLSLKNSFKEQIFSLSNMETFSELAKQCTGDTYIKMANLLADKERNIKKIKKLIKSRYRIFTYEAFASFIEKDYDNKIVKDKVIIIDEAHNIRSISNNETVEKRVYTSLTNILKDGINNRLILLSATPMYNEPEDIMDLLYLLCLNDKRSLFELPLKLFNDKGVLNKNNEKILAKLSSNYISYLRGRNPFTFAIKISAKMINKYDYLKKEYLFDSNGNKIQTSDKGWLSKIEDGITTSLLSKKQLEYISIKKELDENNVFNNLQPMNIVYDNMVGEKGFDTFFIKENNTSLYVKYNTNYNNALHPDNIEKYSGKFKKVCDIIKNSTGPIVIYSRYIWAGIIPIAVMLEHLGFNREGSNNILINGNITKDVNYGFSKSPKYCILSSENREIMGTSTIDDLIKTINNTKNIDGSLIKVILMTPVAGEGLSFYNIREMHLIEPWFHFNRVQQIIGRGIRNCRHQDLPLEERNVSIFIHGSIEDDSNKETADIHAFRISSRKLIQTDVVDTVIRNNSVDCVLMKNINYFPKDLFNMKTIKLKSSQGEYINYTFGDDEKYEPKCIKSTDALVYTGFRKETYEHFIPSIKLRLRNLILQKIRNGIRYISFDEIIDNIKYDKRIIYEGIKKSIYPSILIEGYTLILHNNGIHIIDVGLNIPVKLRILFNKEPEKIVNDEVKCNYKKIMKKATIQESILALYMSLNMECFEEIVKRIVENDEISETDTFIADCLYKEGALISSNEIKSLKLKSKYIGYINIFTNKFEPQIYIDNKYRDLIKSELDELIANRTKILQPENMSKEKIAWGIIAPLYNKKTAIYTNQFKLLTIGASTGVKTGIDCNSLQKKAHSEILEQIGDKNIDKNTKIENCNKIALLLYKIGRLSLNPMYKSKL